jgi:hypothetical protein
MDRYQRQSQDNKSLLVILSMVGAALICACCGVAGIFLYRAVQNGSQGQMEVKNLTVKISAPARLKYYQDFVVEMQLNNTGSRPQQLHSIDIHENYMNGVKVNSSEPAYTHFLTFEGGGLFYSYDFMREIPANSTLVVKFAMTAIYIGDYAGDVYVCVNSATLCNVYRIAAHIEQAESGMTQ